MSAEKWEEAVDSFSLSNEADTSELLDECYKHIKSDYSFQEVFEECIAFRCSDEAEDMTGADISQAELEKLKPFVTADFYSADLKNIAQKYYKALELQHNYYVDEDGNYDVEDWRDAYLTRMSIIYQLIKDYDFFADNIAVRDEYTEYGEEAPLCIKAERDLDWQRDNDFDNYFDIDDDGQVYFTFRNDQDYNISVHVDMYYDYEDGEEEGYYWDFPRVKANSTFTLTIPERNPDKEGTWSWSMFFDVLDVVD